ncbi:AAA family ATPase [Cellulosimicrobium sp. Marseille-Q8652]
MHLHSLAFQAIGPFAGRHRIDLATLGASGIFLLDGPTGAGKSTIIDTIVFALYGKVASEATSDDRLRSAFAAGDVESFVDLVLEVPGGVFRVRRTPEYRRPKKRGEGTTTQQASVRLWRLPAVPSFADEDPQGELLSARLDEAGAEIQRLVGLDRRQLVQTVVLPQGEFASFLRAEPEKRRDLLQKVFGTEVYERAAARLGELARAARARTETARQGVTGAVEHFAGATGLALEAAHALREAARDDACLRRAAPEDVAALLAAGVADPGAGSVVPPGAPAAEAVGEAAGEAPVRAGVHALALAHARRRAAEADELVTVELTANGALVAARDRLEAERSTAAALDRRAALRTERARLTEAEPRVAEHRRRLDAAARAAVVAPAARGAVAAARVLGTALEREELARAGVPPELAGADESTLEAVRSELLTVSVRVERLLPVGAALPGRERELADGRKDVERAVEERHRVLAELAGRPAVRDTLRRRVAELGETAGRLGELQERALRARAVATAASDAEALEVDLAHAVDDRTRAAQRARDAVEAERDVRDARIAGIAGELASGLGPAASCPVCGSLEHPRPATRTEDHVTPAEVDAAEAARVAAETALADASGRVVALTERRDALRHAAEGRDAREAHERVAAVEAEVRAAREAVAERSAAERALDEHDAVTTALQEQAGALAETVAAGTSRLDELAAAVAADRAEVARETAAALALVGGPDDAAPSDDPDGPDAAARPDGSDDARRGVDVGGSAGGARNPVAVLGARLVERVRSVAALTEAHDAVAVARRDVERREAEVADLVSQGGFADARHALAAVLDDAERSRLEHEVSQHASALAMLRAGLADPSVAALAEDATADVDAARAAVVQAEEAARTATRRHDFAVRQAAAAADGADAVGTAVDAWHAALDDAAPVARMAALSAGTGSDNVHALSLATYVLVQRFEDVVAAANERLAEMSSGRYELVRSASREDVRSRRTGLAMKVVDHVTERERDPRTLSGGETFYVSLCLALGLADVVTAEAGGVELGTLFVDEGFGSLDAETLDVVLGALGRLRAGGRVVGVVSHVEALKQAVAERVEVRRAPGGGSTLTVRA